MINSIQLKIDNNILSKHKKNICFYIIKNFDFNSRDLVEKNLYVKSCIEKSDASQLEKRKRQKSGKRVKGTKSF